MTRKSVITIATVAAIASAAIVGTAAVDRDRIDSRSCTCSTVDLEDGRLTLVVVANGSESASVSQQISQTNDETRVRMDIEHGDTSVEIAGETVENGSLVLNVTRNGEVVNESLEVDAGEIDTVAFHLEPDAVRISTREGTSSECPCAGMTDVVGTGDDSNVSVNLDLSGACGIASDVAENVSTGDKVVDTNVNAGNVAVNVTGSSTDDSAGDAEQVIDDAGDEFQSEQNSAGSDDAVTDASEKCLNASSGDGDSPTDISPPERLSDSERTERGVFRVAIRSNDLAGLAVEGDDRTITLGGLLSVLDSGENPD